MAIATTIAYRTVSTTLTVATTVLSSLFTADELAKADVCRISVSAGGFTYQYVSQTPPLAMNLVHTFSPNIPLILTGNRNIRNVLLSRVGIDSQCTITLESLNP